MGDESIWYVKHQLLAKYNFSFLYAYIGCVTNGEFNSLRCRGYERPLSILQIKADVRKQFSKLSLKSMLPMITPKRELHNADIDVNIRITLLALLCSTCRFV